MKSPCLTKFGCGNQIIEKEDYTVERDNRTNEYHIHRNGGHMYRAIKGLPSLQINNTVILTSLMAEIILK